MSLWFVRLKAVMSSVFMVVSKSETYFNFIYLLFCRYSMELIFMGIFPLFLTLPSVLCSLVQISLIVFMNAGVKRLLIFY